MSNSRLTVAYLTSGAGGMYCGSCLHDNTLARALCQLGVDAQLIPTYTPIRTDEDDISVDQVFFGGANVFLQQKIPFFRFLPGFFDRILDHPKILRWLTSRGMETSAKQLGALAVSMLRGVEGNQRKEVRRLCSWLKSTVKPDLIVTSSVLIAGCAATLKQQLKVPILVTLQGDDIFLEGLIEPYKSQALDQIENLVKHVDGFLVNSEYYRDFMSDYLKIDKEKFRVVPLGLDVSDFADHAAQPIERKEPRPPTVGFLARLAEEKGLHILVEAFLLLRRLPGTESTRLHIAGWLGSPNEAYANEQFAKLEAAGLSDAFCYAGTVSRREKIEFLHGLDVLSVPTTYREPKGLFVLEAIAAGVPVVQPDHGAFPELIQRLGGGRLTPPNDPEQLAAALHELLTNPEDRKELASRGRELLHKNHHAEAMAQATLDLYASFLPAHQKSID